MQSSDSEDDLDLNERLGGSSFVNDKFPEIVTDPTTDPPLQNVDSQLAIKEEDSMFDDDSAPVAWREFDREKKKQFIEKFSTVEREGPNYAFHCKFCGKFWKGQYLTALVHISGVKVRGPIYVNSKGCIRAAPCALTINPEEGMKVREEVLNLFEVEDQIPKADRKRKSDGIDKRSNSSSSQISTTYQEAIPSENFDHLLPRTFKEEVIQWIKEDCPTTDIGGFVVGEKHETAHLYCKSPGSTIVAGIPFASAAYEYCGLRVKWNLQDGMCVNISPTDGGKVVIATVQGKCRDILLAERVSLNILSRASGVASAARHVANIKSANNWHGFVAGTRKTTPGFKNVEKYALVVGGAATHRLDLSQMVMLKDNHIWSAGSITNAVKKARLAGGFSIKIEVECQNVPEALEAAAAGADITMLDNFTSLTIGDAAAQVKKFFPHVLVEASGGITMDTIAQFMHTSVDIISMGALTQGYSCKDFSLKIQHN